MTTSETRCTSIEQRCRSGWILRLTIASAVVLLWQAASIQAATTVTKIAAGPEHSLFIKSDGSLWAMGENDSGQLGDGSCNDTNRPTQIVSGGVSSVTAGGLHTLFLKSDGSLWAMGNNYFGQLGIGITNSPIFVFAVPQKIVSGGVVAIAAGGNHSLFVKSDGSLWTMGWNLQGQLGDGTTNGSNVPKQVVSSGVVAVAAGGYHSLFLKSDGSLWAMGLNSSGQLGDGTTTNSQTPEQVVASGVVAVAVGECHSLFIKSDGSLWAMGDNRYGQLGDGTTDGALRPEQIVSGGVVAAATGVYDSLCLKSDGSVWAMGSSGFGQLANGASATNRPVQIFATGVKEIACGWFDSLFVKTDGSLWDVGVNFYGGLGDGFAGGCSHPEQVDPPTKPILASPVLADQSTQTTVKYIAAGNDSSFFVEADGSLWAMGANYDGELGDGTSASRFTPVQIVSGGVVAVATGGNPGGAAVPSSHSLFLKSDGSLWAMGLNSSGQLGDGTTTNSQTPEQVVVSGVVAVAAGEYHSLFIKSDGSLWGMGYNNAGQLGDGTTDGALRPEQIVSGGVVAIAAGALHSLFIKSDGSLWGMGYNNAGQLGDGTYRGQIRPERIVSNGVIAAAAGFGHSLFLKSDGSLWAVGDNRYGQLGDGTTNNNAFRPEEIVARGVVAIAAGALHSLFLKSDGSLWGMGYNNAGQLGDGTSGFGNSTNKPERIVPAGAIAAAAGCFHSLVLKSDGGLWGMGDNSQGELGNGSRSSPFPEKLAGGPWLHATCRLGGTYCLLSSTKLAQPLSQWARIWTNSVALRGSNNFSAPLSNEAGASAGPRFFILQSE